MLILEHAGKRQAGLLGLGKRAYIALAQLGQQCEKYFARNNGVGERGVAIFDVYTKPARQLLQRVAPKIGFGYLRQKPGIKRARRNPGQGGALAFTLDHGKIEPESVSDQYCVGGRGGDVRPHGGEFWCRGHHAVINGVDARRVRSDRFAGIDQSPQRGSFVESASPQRYRTDLDDPRLRRIEASRLGIEDDGVESDQRCCVGNSRHWPPGLARRIINLAWSEPRQALEYRRVA